MIQCDEYQKKIAAVFDNEASESDKSIISEHVENCPECRAFHIDIIKMRQALVSLPVPPVSLEFSPEIASGLEASGDNCSRGRSKKETIAVHLPLRFRRLAWIGSLAATFLIIFSLVIALIQSKKLVSDLVQFRQFSAKICPEFICRKPLFNEFHQ